MKKDTGLFIIIILICICLILFNLVFGCEDNQEQSLPVAQHNIVKQAYQQVEEFYEHQETSTSNND